MYFCESSGLANWGGLCFASVGGGCRGGFDGGEAGGVLAVAVAPVGGVGGACGW